MGHVVYRAPDGQDWAFKIDGDQPTQTEISRIQSIMANSQEPQTATQAPDDAANEPGILASIGHNVARSYYEAKSGVDLMKADYYRTQGDEETAKKYEQSSAEELKARDTYSVRPKGLTEEETWYGTVANAAGQAANMVAPIGVGLGVGAAAGAASGPFAPVVGPVVGAVAGAAAFAPQIFSQNAERQIQEHGYINDWRKLELSTAAESSLQGVTETLTGGIAGLFSKPFAKALSSSVIAPAVDTAVGKALTSLGKKYGIPAAAGMINASVANVLSSGASRWQAELPLMSDDAKKEYLESAIVGGLIGGVTGVGVAAHTHFKTAAEQAKFKQAFEDAQAERDAQLAAQTQYGQQYEANAKLPYLNPPAPEEPGRARLTNEQMQDPNIRATLLGDQSGPTREQLAADKAEAVLPAGLQDQEIERATPLAAVADIPPTVPPAVPQTPTELAASQLPPRTPSIPTFDWKPYADQAPRQVTLAADQTKVPQGHVRVSMPGAEDFTVPRSELTLPTSKVEPPKTATPSPEVPPVKPSVSERAIREHLYGQGYSLDQVDDIVRTSSPEQLAQRFRAARATEATPAPKVGERPPDAAPAPSRKVNPEQAATLGNLGYTQSEIDNMTPDQAQHIVTQAVQRGSSNVNEPVKTQERPYGPQVSSFDENEYRAAINQLRTAKSVSVDRIINEMKWPKAKAEAVFNEMLRRNDGYPAGGQNQYLKITVPHGMDTRTMSDQNGRMMPHRSRDYVVKRVQPANFNPFTINIGDKRLGTKLSFRSREDAEAYIRDTLKGKKQKEASVVEDNSGYQYGIHELQYEHRPGDETPGSGTLVGEKVVNTFSSEAEARDAIKEYDPAYSPESNKWRVNRSDEEIANLAKQDTDREMGSLSDILRGIAKRIVGEGRVNIKAMPLLDKAGLLRLGVPLEKIPENLSVIEGVTMGDIRQKLEQVIGLAAHIYDPSLSEAEKVKAMNHVMNHEFIHVARNLGLLTQKEWNHLFHAAFTQNVPGKNYTWAHRAYARNPGRPGGIVAEEAVAEMFRSYAHDPTSVPNKERGLLRKLASFVRKLIGLGKRNKAADVMDAILGGELAKRQVGSGVGPNDFRPRNRDDVMYSMWKPDNFYSANKRFVEGVQKDEMEPLKWWNYIKNAGLEHNAETKWLGMKDWLTSLSQGPDRKPLLHKNDILQFIQANSPKISSLVRSKNESLHPMHYTEDTYEGKAGYPVEGKWEESHSLGPGKDYFEVAFTMPPRDGEPDFPGNAMHFSDENGDAVRNVIAFARGKTVEANGKKYLRVDEMQSDLHQKASGAGGYFSKTLYDEMNHWQDEANRQSNIFYEQNDRIAELRSNIVRLQNEERELVRLHDIYTKNGHRDALVEVTDALKKTGDQLIENRRLQDEAYTKREAADEAANTASKRARSLSERMEFPNLPFKGTWEEYVFKRMVRHAAENGYDGIIWHGEPQSITETEGYHGVEMKPDEKGRPQYLLDTGFDKPKNLTRIYNRYLQTMPEIARKILKIFGGGDLTINDPDFTPVSKLHEGWGNPEWQPPAMQMGDWGDVRANLGHRNDLNYLVEDLQRSLEATDWRGYPPEEEQAAEQLVQKFEHAAQIAHNQRSFDIETALNGAGIDLDQINDAYRWIDGSWEDVMAGPGEPKAQTTQQGSFPYQYYKMDITPEMREAFSTGNVPLFSQLAPSDAEMARTAPEFRAALDRPDFGPKYSMTAPMGQRFPPIPPIDRLDQIYRNVTTNNLEEALFKVSRGVTRFLPKKFGDRIQGYAENAATNGIFRLQDKNQPQAALSDMMKKDGTLAQQNDFFMRANMYPSITEDRMQHAAVELQQPIMKAVAELPATRADLEQLKRLNRAAEQFLGDRFDNDWRRGIANLAAYAEHAEERNMVMQARNEKAYQENLATAQAAAARNGVPFDPNSVKRADQYDHGSGMRTSEAHQIIDWINSKAWGGKVRSTVDPNSIRMLIRKMISGNDRNATNQARVDAGTSFDFRNLNYPDGTPMNVYSDYVPVRGFAQEDDAPDHLTDIYSQVRVGRGMSVGGKEDRAAAGRKTLAIDPIETAILQNQAAIIRAEKNNFANTFADAINYHPGRYDSIAEEIHPPRTTYQYNSQSGNVVQRVDPSLYGSDPTIFKFKTGGEQRFMRIKDPLLAKSLNETSLLGDNAVAQGIKVLGAINGYLGKVRTQWSPEFGIVNGVRDLFTAFLNVPETAGYGTAWKVVRDMVPIAGGLYRMLRSGNYSSDLGKLYQEFKARGGHTASFRYQDMDAVIRDFTNEVKDMNGGALHKSKNAFRKLGDIMSAFNTAIEDATRLSVYKNLRDYYITQTADPRSAVNIERAKEMAAFMSKNMTINFNTGGSDKAVLNAAWLFYNASLQGSVALINPVLRSRRMQYQLAAIMGFGAMASSLASLFSPQDDKGNNAYDELTKNKPWVLESNIVLPDVFGITKKGFITIPMPYGFSAFYNLGRTMMNVARGQDVGTNAASAMGGIFSIMNPLGAANSFLNWVAPSIADPFIDITTNKDWTGKPISPPDDPYGRPSEVASQRYWNNTNPAYVTIADWLSQMTGRKTDYIPGVFGDYGEVSPNTIGYWVDFVTGSAGSTVARTINVLSKTVGGAPGGLEISDIPFARRLYTQVGERENMAEYVRGRDDIMRVRQSLTKAIQSGDTKTVAYIRSSFPDEIKLMARINSMENARRKWGTLIKKARDNTHISDAERQKRVQMLHDRQTKIVQQAIDMMNQAGI